MGSLARITVSAVLLLFLYSCDRPTAAGGNLAGVASCPLGEAKVTDGVRRLALIVGIGDYLNPNINDLAGPPNDARLMYELLTDADSGYRFPTENVCLLLDAAATTANIEQAFADVLTARAQKDDVVVIYFAGHGSQRKDANNDEPDGLDETWVLHDSRTGGQPDLVDDRIHALLTTLHDRTSRITVILDSCNAGTATRGGTGFSERFAVLDDTPLDPATAGLDGGDGNAGQAAASLPGLVQLTAAADGTSALERGGRGIFTDALVKVLSEGQDAPLSYAQVARRVPPLVAETGSAQIPYFQGELNQAVFANRGILRPAAWEVKAVGASLELAGPPVPGMGAGAEMRIYDGALAGDRLRDPAQAKATVVVEETTGLNAKARILSQAPNAAEVRLGDIAVPIRPADEFIKIGVRMRSAAESGGIPSDRAEALRRAIVDDPEIGRLVSLVSAGDDFELSLGVDGEVVVRDHDGRSRNRVARDELVPGVLWNHARQRALLALRGEGGDHFADNQSLQVRLQPAGNQSACADVGAWQAAAPNQEQIVPLCLRFKIAVELAGDAPMPLLVGALFLSNDGSIFGLPRDGAAVLLRPGEGHVFATTFEGRPPLDVRDMVVVFGTQETNPVSWNALTSVVQTRSVRRRGGSNPLEQALMRYFSGTRGAVPVSDTVEDTTWTRSVLPLRVEANLRFVAGGRDGGEFAPREYTIPDFDIRPYLPDDTGTALYQVLQQADWLARYGGSDGVDYRQHPWDGATDADNLAVGIDCSRAIWFAFDRAGLRYNRDNRYLTTANMVTGESLMHDEFERCDGVTDQRLGDILVYRDDQRGDGHVVMVVDPARRIAWGSHGWDGNAKKFDIPVDRGVEYQKIKFKPDWQAWDRSTMRLKACWRYRRFDDERLAARGVPGSRALTRVCDEQACRSN